MQYPDAFVPNLDAKGHRQVAKPAAQFGESHGRTAQAAIDELGHRLLLGPTVVVLCDPIDADLVERHARIYATMPAH